MKELFKEFWFEIGAILFGLILSLVLACLT